MTNAPDNSSKVVLITGCASPAGIGFASARALAEAGHRVWATVRDLPKADALAAGVDPENLRVRFLDLNDAASIQAVVEEAIARDGRLDVLINNAGYGLLGGVEQADLARVRAQFDTNLIGTLRMIQSVLPTMRAQRAGLIVNLSTIFSAQHGLPGIGLYIASKAALDTACEALAVEVAPWNICVTNLQPGPVMTELERETSNRFSAEGDPYAGLIEKIYQWVQSDRGPARQEPAEIAAALVALVAEPDPPVYRQTRDEHAEFVARQWRDPSGAEIRTRFAPFLPLRNR